MSRLVFELDHELVFMIQMRCDTIKYQKKKMSINKKIYVQDHIHCSPILRCLV